MAIIKVENISKYYPMNRGRRTLIGKGGLSDWFRGEHSNRFAALDGVSLTVGAGEALGIIGRNGSGKSTLLKILAGVTLPSEGQVQVQGRVASLLELGAGFHPMLTGRENIYLNAGLLGMRHAQVDAVYDEIVNFSGIASFINETVDTYSSGMYVRIAFSVAAHTNPDIFLVDEVLAVGDAEFQRKCRRKIGELREQGKTIVFVSHDISLVNTLCEQVVLLNKGQVIQRDTPQKTIAYYMRQVGMEKGLHNFQCGDLEVIKCDGRLSLFHRQEELSSPAGFRMQFVSLGQYHFSDEAEWEIVERDEQGCYAIGRMMRLPILLHWRLFFEEGRLHWQIVMECEHAVSLDNINAVCYITTSYTEWMYGDLGGAFPELLPTDLQWNVVVAPEQRAMDAAALPAEDAPLPPLLFHLDTDNPYFGLMWANSEYMEFSRVLSVDARFPEHDNQFQAGRHELLSLCLDVNVARDEIRNRVMSDHQLEVGKFKASFEHGFIRLSYDGDDITSYLHLYASMLQEQLWNDSYNLHWGPLEQIEDGIQIVGASRRFPFAQEWTLRRAADGLQLSIVLINEDVLQVDEYHCSIVLRPDYTHWHMDTESATFPAFDPKKPHWAHCNQSFAPGTRIRAEGEAFPTVEMQLDETSPSARMTPINTTYQENARVIQALFVSDQGRLLFAPGRHTLFSGHIRLQMS